MEDAVAAALAVAVGIAVQRAAALLLCWRLAFFLNISVRERERAREGDILSVTCCCLD